MKTKLNYFQKLLLASFAVIGIIVVASNHSTVLAATSPDELQNTFVCQGDAASCACPTTGDKVADCGRDSAIGCTDAADCNLVQKYVNPFIKFIAIVAGMAVTIGIIIGGIQYASSGGDPQKAAAAKNRIRNAVIALLVYFFLYAILRFLIPSGNLIQ